uniref:BED-type domain-containing protein n=1 Tax=Plectus sambesii TaxID=2011161 RepID=A0A914W7Z6_9BILA
MSVTPADDVSVADSAFTDDGNRERIQPGRKRSHPLWELFDDEDGISCCTLCAYKVKEKFTSTLLNHLSSKHLNKYRRIATIKQEKDSEREKVKAKQPKMKIPADRLLQYWKNSAEQKEIDENQALFANSTSFAYHLVKSFEFADFVFSLNPRYQLPSREMLKKSVLMIANQIKTNIKELLKDAGKVSLCIDLWCQKTLFVSYLAVTGHFYCYKTGELENVCLAVKEMTSRHTAQVIKAMTQEILMEFELTKDRILRYRADNGANIVAAFRESLIDITAKILNLDDSEITAAQVQ